jgi:hypothetical protein
LEVAAHPCSAGLVRAFSFKEPPTSSGSPVDALYVGQDDSSLVRLSHKSVPSDGVN